jgi:predicted dehydrogenase
MSPRHYDRREFISRSSTAALGAAIVPSHVLGGRFGRAPSQALNIAIVGAGGMGGENAQELLSENLTCVCDVDMAYVTRKVEERTKERDGTPREKGVGWQQQFNRATKYTDFREMLARETDLDGVVIATPDHAHAAIAKAAMEAGRHVYVQKPLTYTVHEARVLRDVARRTGVVTQMGNQGHSSDEARLINEWVHAGVLGAVREVHVWTNRPIWPQGVPWPSLPDRSPDPTNWGRGAVTTRTAESFVGSYPPPAGLRWDLYLGPEPQDIPYHPIYHPFNWRGWIPFGVGALGDMGAHLVDHPYWALELGYPAAVQASSTPFGGPRDDPASFPLAMTATYEFPARGSRPPVVMRWYDGGLLPQRPAVLPADVELNAEGGVLFIGERGVLMHETYGRKPTLYPASLMDEAKQVPQTLPRIEGPHEMNWVRAIRGETQASSPFDYAAPLTEVMLLGVAALRAGQGVRIEIAPDGGAITNLPEANRYLTRGYRAGWEV